MYDKKSTECKLFNGDPMAFHDDCNEFGYSVEPDYDQCCDVEPAGDPNECDVRKFNISINFKYD